MKKKQAVGLLPVVVSVVCYCEDTCLSVRKQQLCSILAPAFASSHTSTAAAPTTPTPAPTQLGGDTPFPTFQPTAAPTLSPQPTTTPQPMTTAQPTTAAENPTSGLPPTRNQPSPNGGTAGIRSVEQEGDSGLNGGAIAAIAAGGALLVLGGVLFAKRGGEEPV